MLGSGTLSSGSASTDSSGAARSVLALSNIHSEVRVSACVGVAPQTACDIFYVYPVSSSGAQLFKAGGDAQYAIAGETFAPVAVRVLDSNVPPNTLSGVPVNFHVTVSREAAGGMRSVGEVTSGHRAQPVVLSVSDSVVYTDGWGQAALTPQISAAWGAVRIDIEASTPGGQAVTFTLHTLGGTRASGAERRDPGVRRKAQDARE